MKGRKRHILVDTLGVVVDVDVHVASFQDRAGGVPLADRVARQRPSIRHIWGDSGYTGGFIRAARRRGYTVEIVKRSDLAGSHGIWHDPQMPLPIVTKRRFVLMKRRWVVERTFAWLGRYRRLAKDYEQLTEVSRQMVWAALCRLMCQRLAFAE